MTTLRVAGLVALAGCGEVQRVDPVDVGVAETADAADSATREVGDAGAGCPVDPPPKVGRADCVLGTECRYYDSCWKGGSGDRYVCVWPFEQPKQWVRTELDCSVLTRPDGCPLTVPLLSTLCPTPGQSCKYKGCSRYVCTPEPDAGLSVWQGNIDDCFADAGPG